MLTQLVCLRAWHHSLTGGEIKNLTSLQELHIYPGMSSDDNESKGQFVKDLGNLRELRALRVFTAFNDKRMQSDFVKSLGNLHKLQRLKLDGVSIEKGEDGDGDCRDYNIWKLDCREDNKWQLLLLLPRGLCQLVLYMVPELPSCIDPSRLPNLTHLTLTLIRNLGDKGLKILGELPELLYLKLMLGMYLDSSRAMITGGTAAHVYFQKLRTCLLPDSLVQFVINKDSSVSFTIWAGTRNRDVAPIFEPRKKQDSCIRVSRSVMPNLEELYFYAYVTKIVACNNVSCDNLGLECLASLKKVRVDFDCWCAPLDEVDKEEVAMRHAIQVHPNQPILQIKFQSKSKPKAIDILSDNDEYLLEKRRTMMMMMRGRRRNIGPEPSERMKKEDILKDLCSRVARRT
ncbi:hypothetical protein BS78_K262100 [Paspalum vaginatum]|uniref:Disease resistance R13L4/SHOC-2-like LRR domain-containing protein n=1 Tax=Paspalum vaginatum TaxID=158149 RepID=A0A9W8CGK9_9POAL|nr:hypothetical protein BS78_K262100 [Paspalum vaginatum]